MPKERGNGNGGVFKITKGKHKGKWCTVVTTGKDPNGKRLRAYRYSKTKAEANQKLKELMTKPHSGVVNSQGKTKLCDYLNWWLDVVCRAGETVRPKTLARYESIVKNYLVPSRLAPIRLDELTPVHIRTFYSDLTDAGKSASLKRHCHVVLSSALNHAVGDGILVYSPCNSRNSPKYKAAPTRALDHDDTQRFLEASRDDRFHALYCLAVWTGMRIGELLALHWEDIDLDRGILSVRHTLMELGRRLELCPPKSDAGIRKIDLPQVAVANLSEHRLRMKAEGYEGPLVFCDTEGGFVRAGNLRRRSFYPLLRKAGLAKMRFHDLRHTAVTMLIDGGENLKVIQERVGHADSGLILRTYAHALPSMQKGAADLIDRLFGKEEK